MSWEFWRVYNLGEIKKSEQNACQVGVGMFFLYVDKINYLEPWRDFLFLRVLKGGELRRCLEPDPHRLNSSVSFYSNFNCEWSTASPELIDIRY